MNDPYKVLGVSPMASDEEIKKAYRDLARKYHPDKYAGSDLAELAEEKMKEINAAYEQIQSMRARGQSQAGSGSAYGDFSGFGTSYNSSDTSIYATIRRAINVGDIASAQNYLDNIPFSDRGAEWNFLAGCVALRRGYYADAQRFIDIACNQDPNNEEYRRAREALHSRTAGFGSGYHTERHSTSCGCCDCDCCTSLICADCCCECMGGDLISCC